MATSAASSQSVEELCESIVSNTLNRGALKGLVFRHGASDQKAKREMIVCQADKPEPRLEGEQGFLVTVTVTMRATSAARSALFHKEAMTMLANRDAVLKGALAAGLTGDDNLTILNDQITGGRENTDNLRKRTIEIPFIIALSS